MGTKYEEYLFRDEALHVPRFVCVGRGEVGGWGFIYVARKNSIYEAVCVFTGELCSQHVLAKQSPVLVPPAPVEWHRQPVLESLLG